MTADLKTNNDTETNMTSDAEKIKNRSTLPQRWSKFKGSFEETGCQGMFSKSRLISWCDNRGQGGSSSVDSTVTDPLFVK